MSELLITDYSNQKLYLKVDLREANLNEVNLKQFHFSKATLKVASLDKTNLTEVYAIE